MRHYRWVKSLDQKIHQLRWLGTRWRYDIWTWCKIRGKDKKCAVLGTVIARGSEAYMPITNGQNRMDRVSPEGMQELIRRGQ